jgi:hypothetical protein
MRWRTHDPISVSELRTDLLTTLADHLKSHESQSTKTEFRVLCAIRMRDACVNVGIKEALSFEISIAKNTNDSIATLISEMRLYNDSTSTGVAYSVLLLRLYLTQPASLAVTLPETQVPMFLLIEKQLSAERMYAEAGYTESTTDVYWNVCALNPAVASLPNIDANVINSTALQQFWQAVGTDKLLQTKTQRAFHNGTCGKLLSQLLQQELFHYLSTGNRHSGPTKALAALKAFCCSPQSVISGDAKFIRSLAKLPDTINNQALSRMQLVRIRNNEQMSQHSCIRLTHDAAPRQIVCTVRVDATQVEFYARQPKAQQISATELVVQLSGREFVRETALLGFVQNSPTSISFNISGLKLSVAPEVALLGTAVAAQELSDHLCARLALLCRGYALLFDQTASLRVIDEVVFRYLDSVRLTVSTVSMDLATLITDWMTVYTAARVRPMFEPERAESSYSVLNAYTVLQYAGLSKRYKTLDSRNNALDKEQYKQLFAELSAASQAVQTNSYAAALLHMYCCAAPLWIKVATE